jgi:hypothetical protein
MPQVPIRSQNASSCTVEIRLNSDVEVNKAACVVVLNTHPVYSVEVGITWDSWKLGLFLTISNLTFCDRVESMKHLL